MCLIVKASVCAVFFIDVHSRGWKYVSRSFRDQIKETITPPSGLPLWSVLKWLAALRTFSMLSNTSSLKWCASLVSSYFVHRGGSPTPAESFSPLWPDIGTAADISPPYKTVED